MSAYVAVSQRGQRAVGWSKSRGRAIALIMVAALIAFEIFNFDTTNYALASLLGDISFAGLKWSAVLAFAFCAIDFAGLARIFTPQKTAGDEPKEVWYLMGAWFLGATMNAVMTWWAVSVTLIGHELGNEVLSREMLLRYVPPFVALLVWTTRILFIGAISMAGESLFYRDESQRNHNERVVRRQPVQTPQRSRQPRPVRRRAAVQRQSAPTRSTQPQSPRPVRPSSASPPRRTPMPRPTTMPTASAAVSRQSHN